MRMRKLTNRLHRACPFLARLCQDRVLTLTAMIGAAAIFYYLHYYKGMSLHVQLPGMSVDNSDDPGFDAPLPIPKFENLLSPASLSNHTMRDIYNKKSKLKKGSVKVKTKRPKDHKELFAQSKAPEKPTNPPVTKQQLRRRRGDAEYLPNINVTIVHAPNLTNECFTGSRLLFLTASNVLGDVPEASAAGKTTSAAAAEAAKRQRQAVRETWGFGGSLAAQDLPETWRSGCVIFYILTRDTAAQQLMMKEAEKTQDLIILSADSGILSQWSPHELDIICTAKVLFHLSGIGRPPDGYTIRTNHKAFWNIHRLVKFLQGTNGFSNTNIDAGNSSQTQTVLQLAGKSVRSDWVHRDPLDPSYTSKRQFADQMYPESALDNPGYAISNRALKVMSKLADSTPLVYYRDVYLSGVLRQKAGIQLDLVADIKAARAVPVSPCHYRLFVATPTVEADEMLNVWPQYRNPNHKCSYTVIDADSEAV